MSLETEISIMLEIMMVLEIWCWKYGVGNMVLEIWCWKYGVGNMVLGVTD